MESIANGAAAVVAVAFSALIEVVCIAFEKAASSFSIPALWQFLIAAALAEMTLWVMHPFYKRSCNRVWNRPKPHHLLVCTANAFLLEERQEASWSLFSSMLLCKISDFDFTTYSWKKVPLSRSCALFSSLCWCNILFRVSRFKRSQFWTALLSECSLLNAAEAHVIFSCDATKVHKLVVVLLYAILAKLFWSFSLLGLGSQQGILFHVWLLVPVAVALLV